MKGRDEGSWRLHPFGRPGGDLLSRALRRSTIGPGRLNDRVRNGIGWGPSGIVTRSTKRMREAIIILNTRVFSPPQVSVLGRMSSAKNNKADRAISTGKLHASQRFHIRPINVV